MANAMKHTSRRLTVALAAICATAALALAGCSSGTPAASDTGPVTLTVWHYYNTAGQVATLQKLADDFQSKHKNVTVKFQYVSPDTMTNKAVQAAGAKTGPDVLVFGASGTYPLATSGALAPMDWWSKFSGAKQVPDALLQKVNGKLYGAQGYVNLVGLWYNQDMMTQLGISAPPTTVAELEADMALAVAAGKQGITLTGNPGLESQWQAFPWFTSNGFSYKNAKAASISKTFAMVQNWVAKGYLSKEATTWDQTIPFQNFVAGQSLFAENGNWQITAAKAAKFKYGVALMPISSTGGVLLGGEVENVGGFSKHKELAQEFLQDEFFSVKGELTLLDGFGTMPARADASTDQITSDPILSVFAQIVQKQGAPSPSPFYPSANVSQVEPLVGNFWSKAIAGQGTPDDLANQLMQQLTPLLKG